MCIFAPARRGIDITLKMNRAQGHARARAREGIFEKIKLSSPFHVELNLTFMSNLLQVDFKLSWDSS